MLPSSPHPSPDLRIEPPPRPAAPAAPPEEVHPLEQLLALLAGLNLCFLPWAFGGVDVWSQLVSAGLAAGTLLTALLPRGGGRRPDSRPRLSRFPVFWAGLALFAYVAIQALNPAFEYKSEGTAWWLVRTDHIGWLPAGMTAPFGDSNPWRSLLVWGSCWMTVCGLWAGVTHRRTLLRLLTALSVNGFAFASFGIVQRASGTDRIYWSRSVGFPYFFAAIIYKNHAAAFFILLTAVTMGLTIRAFWQNRRQRSRSSPAIMFLFFTFILILAIGLSFSISGLVLFAALLLAVAPVTIRRYVTMFPRAKSRLPVLLTAGLLVVLAAGLGAAGNHGDLSYKIHVMMAGNATHSMRTRRLALRRGWQMFTDRWVTGWGAGCFEYGFTKYQHLELELTRLGGVPLRWEHVHNDWLELLIELGVAGALPVLFMLAYGGREIIRLRLWQKPALQPLLCGLGAVLVYGFCDFPLHNPAVAATAGALFPLLTRWGELENAAQAGRRNRPD